MTTHKVVKHDEWLAARKKHLAKEKEFTRLRDQLSRERRDLPWELVEKQYTFEGEHGKQTAHGGSRESGDREPIAAGAVEQPRGPG